MPDFSVAPLAVSGPAPRVSGAGPWTRELSAGPRFCSSVDELAALVPDGAVVSCGGFHFCRQPLGLVEAIVRRRAKELTHIQWGGSLALEMLLEAGAVRHVTYCFSNLDVFGLAPNFRLALETGAVTELELTALELHQALLAAQMNLSRLPLQVPLGSWRQDAYQGSGVACMPALELGLVLLHVQRADRLGNLEIDGPLGLDRTLALAGHGVLATVEEIVEPGELRQRAAAVPRQFVAGIAPLPGGAWPASCPGEYVVDLEEIGRRIRRRRFVAAERTGPPSWTRQAAVTPWQTQPWPSAHPVVGVPAVADLMVAWIARQLTAESVCSVGAVSPLATVAYLLAKHDHAPGLTLITASGGCVDVAQRFMSLSLGEAADCQSAAIVCGGDDSYRWYYQQGRVTHEIVGAAQIDGAGRTNNAWLTRPGGTRIRLPGQGGMADVANLHRNFLLYAPRQSRRQLVEHVEWVSAARALRDPAERSARGYGPGGVRLVTDLAVFELPDDSARFRLASLHTPGSHGLVRERTGFDYDEPDNVPCTPPVTEAERAAIDEVDPFGVRGLEFLPARERPAAVDAIVSAERRLVERVATPVGR